jgi:hypothetical protein
MNSHESPIRSRLPELPRAARWAIWAALVLVVYFGAVEPALHLMDRWNLDADRRAEMLAGTERLTARSNRLAAALGSQPLNDVEATLRLATKRMGAVAMPGDPADRRTALEREIETVWSKHEVKNLVYRAKPAAPLGRNVLPELAGPRHVIERLVVDLDFVSTPQVAISILSELEQSPLIASVSKIQVSKTPDEPTVRCTFTVESWLRTPK